MKGLLEQMGFKPEVKDCGMMDNESRV